MTYLSKPRWRWLLTIPLLLTILVLAPLTLLSLTCFNGVGLWFDLVGWSMYEND